MTTALTENINAVSGRNTNIAFFAQSVVRITSMVCIRLNTA